MIKAEDISLRNLEHYLTQILADLKPEEALPMRLRYRVNAIIDLHTGSAQMLDLIDQVQDVELLSRYLGKSLPDLDRDTCRTTFSRAIAARNIPFLSLLVRHGVRISHLTQAMINSALDAQDADFMAFLRAALDDKYHLIRAASQRSFIDECTPPLAPFVEEELLRASPIDITRHIVIGRKHLLTLKTTAALLCLDLPIGLVPRDRFSKPLRPLIDAVNNPLGKVSIRGAEPSLRSVLARPPNGEFFGFQEIISTGGERQVVCCD